MLWDDPLEVNMNQGHFQNASVCVSTSKYLSTGADVNNCFRFLRLLLCSGFQFHATSFFNNTVKFDVTSDIFGINLAK